MAQVKVYALRETLEEKANPLSEAIHSSLVSAIGLPENKKFQRFIPFETEFFKYPADRSDKYTIVEISMFEGRSKEAKKKLIRELYRNIGDKAAIDTQDLEITISETPRENWGIRGLPGDELKLGYSVEQ